MGRIPVYQTELGSRQSSFRKLARAGENRDSSGLNCGNPSYLGLRDAVRLEGSPSVLLSLIQSIANKAGMVSARPAIHSISNGTSLYRRVTFQQTFPQLAGTRLSVTQAPLERFRDLRLHHHAILLVTRREDPSKFVDHRQRGAVARTQIQLRTH